MSEEIRIPVAVEVTRLKFLVTNKGNQSLVTSTATELLMSR